jgi:hypothetical protein
LVYKNYKNKLFKLTCFWLLASGFWQKRHEAIAVLPAALDQLPIASSQQPESF